MALDFSIYGIGDAAQLTNAVQQTYGSRKCGGVFTYNTSLRNNALMNNGLVETRYRGNPNANIYMVDTGKDIGMYSNLYENEYIRPVMINSNGYDLYDFTHNADHIIGLNAAVRERFDGAYGVIPTAMTSTKVKGTRYTVDYIGDGRQKFEHIYGEGYIETTTDGGTLKNRLEDYLTNILGGKTETDGKLLNQYENHYNYNLDDLSSNLVKFSIYGDGGEPDFYEVKEPSDSTKIPMMRVTGSDYEKLDRLRNFTIENSSNLVLNKAVAKAREGDNYLSGYDINEATKGATYYSTETDAKRAALDSSMTYSSDKGTTTQGSRSNEGNSRTYYLYDERNEENGNIGLNLAKNADGNKPDNYTIAEISDSGSNSLLSKTNELFRKGKIGSLINRFHTKGGTPDELNNAVDSVYGLSRGRNLRKGNTTQHYGYDNPYCRVWTSVHQYSKYSNLIRPFTEDGAVMSPDDISSNLGNFRTEKRGRKFSDLSAMEQVGIPRLAPHAPEDVKKCMFSIENLAWKDINFDATIDGTKLTVLSKEQRGPNGGRIMWFPPYNLKFTENVNTNWEGNQFIGRGEQIYTYTNTDRSGTLDFTLLVDHPSIVDRWAYGVDAATKENEQTLLRFFAGCEMLEPSGRGMSCEKEVLNDNKKQSSDLSVTPMLSAQDGAEVDRYYVFFPNDFSGIDYTKSGNNIRTAMNYLLRGNNGVGYEMNSGKSPEKLGCIGADTYTAKNKEGGFTTWYYQPDNRLGNEILLVDEERGINNYKNTTDFGLNKIFGEIAYQNAKGEEYGTKVRALFGLDAVDSGTVFSFYDLSSLNLADIDKYDFDIQVRGFASSHGYNNNNDTLSRNRATAIKQYLESFTNAFPKENERGDSVVRIVESGVLELESGNEDINSFDAKLARCVEVVVRKTLKSNAEPTVESTEGKPVVSEDRGNSVRGNNEENITASQTTTVCQEIEGDIDSFDNESQYFQSIALTDPMVKDNIVKKVKYFDPAFHSITPEGFNGRLSFLHQCTRQGPTTSVSESTATGMGAGNLSFGRPPICVLRIGDFYNTKIIIDYISISYDNGGGIQWDMNPEGIGLQPMFANISISFKFLGGSDLGGPIARLQNAVSSNFYANESIYNHRSDYKEVGSDTVHTWTPNYQEGTDNNIPHKDYKFN